MLEFIHENFCCLYVLSPKGYPILVSFWHPTVSSPQSLNLAQPESRPCSSHWSEVNWSEVMLSPRFDLVFPRLCVTLSRKAPPSRALFIISEVPQTSLAHCPQIQKKICLLPANKTKVLGWDHLLWETLVS